MYLNNITEAIKNIDECIINLKEDFNLSDDENLVKELNDRIAVFENQKSLLNIVLSMTSVPLF